MVFRLKRIWMTSDFRNTLSQTKSRQPVLSFTIYLMCLVIGDPKSVMGEIVFNTGMVGYTETLTDPSYRGQILCFTYPSIGNYGVPSEKDLDEFGLPKYFESNQSQATGVIVHDLSNVSSHWRP